MYRFQFQQNLYNVNIYGIQLNSQTKRNFIFITLYK